MLLCIPGFRIHGNGKLTKGFFWGVLFVWSFCLFFERGVGFFGFWGFFFDAR